MYFCDSTKVTSNQKQDSQPGDKLPDHKFLEFLTFRYALMFILVFWSYVKEYLSKSELERFNTLEHITTDAGRG